MSEGLDDTAVDSAAAAARALARGASVGKYRLDRMLGAGGMGVVWAAHDPDLDRDVALKLLRGADANAALRTRLLREARAMAKLKHPNVLTVYEVGSEGTRDFIAMELVDGMNLDDWIQTRPPRRDVVAALIASGRGLAAAHEAGLVHRDFKPHNVLRDKDGRVLVTDFGLARGVVEGSDALELAPRASDSARVCDPVLDSTLTQTGALIGTPAYMAPEQFAGAAPDPRTDQFAFGVTAWQALAGTRPYSGGTLEELREAISCGRRASGAKLPRAIHRVLARGLDPDPKRRWPDMTALLRQLERATARPARIVAGALAVVGLAGIAAVMLLGRGHDRVVTNTAGACEDGQAAFASAWSPEIRAPLAKRLADGGYTDAVPKWLDGIRTSWLDAYARTCAKPSEPTFHARLGCLLGARDRVAALADLLQRLPIHELGYFDVFGLAPPLAACTTSSPPTPPAMPSDRVTRDKIAALQARAYALRDLPAKSLEAEIKQLEADARALDWAPLVPQIMYAGGVAAHLARAWKLAQDLMPRAAMEAAASRDPAVEAQARIDRYELAINAAENPRDGTELDRLAAEARAAIRGAGDDPVQRAALDIMEARVAVLQHQPDAALAKLPALDTLIAAGDLNRAAIALRWIVDAYLERAKPGDLEAANKRLADLRGKIDAIHAQFADNLLDGIAAKLAWRDGKPGPEADRGGEIIMSGEGPQPGLDHAVDARVVEPGGKPVKGAEVDSWFVAITRGDTAIRVAKNPHTADDQGKATVQIGAGYVRASAPGMRSPVTATSEHLVLRLAPTTSVKVQIRGARPGVDGCLLSRVGDRVWMDRFPVHDDGSFTADLDPSTRICASDGTRRVLGAGQLVEWPAGVPLDVIVRGAAGEPEVWVFRGAVAPRTRTQAEALAARASDVASEPCHAIGHGTATPAGREHYEHGDLHAVFRDTAKGGITACVARDETPAAEVVCAQREIKADAGEAMTLETSFRSKTPAPSD